MFDNCSLLAYSIVAFIVLFPDEAASFRPSKLVILFVYLITSLEELWLLSLLFYLLW